MAKLLLLQTYKESELPALQELNVDATKNINKIPTHALHAQPVNSLVTMIMEIRITCVHQ
jgi:hypothetical protein